jgi:cation diffusion facilitator family transporter
MKEEQIMDRNKVMNTYTSTGMDNHKDKDKNDGTAGNETANSTAASYSGGEEERRENRIIARVSSVGIGGNIALSAFKLAAGILGHSGAMVSDAVHSLSDVFATLIAFVGVHMSRKAPDREHPYGHDRFECVASILLGLVLIATGCAIGYSGLAKIFGGHLDELEAPGVIALIAAIVSIVVKEGMYWYTRHYALILHSDAFMADAWHHRSDAFSSIGSLIGIGGAMLGFPVLDPIASLVICIFIFKVAIDVIREAMNKMLDTSCSPEEEAKIAKLLTDEEGVQHLDLLHTRKFGSKIYVDAEIAVDGDMSLREAHAIAERCHNAVEKEFPDVKHIMIHVNPY